MKNESPPLDLVVEGTYIIPWRQRGCETRALRHIRPDKRIIVANCPEYTAAVEVSQNGHFSLLFCAPRIEWYLNGIVMGGEVYNSLKDVVEALTSYRDVVECEVPYIEEVNGKTEQVWLKYRTVVNIDKKAEVLYALSNVPRVDDYYYYFGFTDEGFVDRRGWTKPPTDPQKAAEYLSDLQYVLAEHYGDSATAALALTAYGLVSPMADVAIPPPRVKTVVWAWGRGGEGKTLLIDSVILRLWGFRRDLPVEESPLPLIHFTGITTTIQQVRNLLSLTNFTLYLDEATPETLDRLAPYILAAATGSIAGLQARRYGPAFEHLFFIRRHLVVVTNVKFERFLKEHASKKATPRAYLRRVRILYFTEYMPTSRAKQLLRDLESMGDVNVIGLVNEVWKRHRPEATSIPDLARIVLQHIEADYGVRLDYFKQAILEVEKMHEDMPEEEEVDEIMAYYKANDRKEALIKALKSADNDILIFTTAKDVQALRAQYEEVCTRLGGTTYKLPLPDERSKEALVEEFIKCLGWETWARTPDDDKELATVLAHLYHERKAIHLNSRQVGNKEEYMGVKRVYHPTKKAHYYPYLGLRYLLDKLFPVYEEE